MIKFEAAQIHFLSDVFEAVTWFSLVRCVNSLILTARQALYKTTSLPPHRRTTACRSTNVIQNFKLTSTQGTKPYVGITMLNRR